MHKVKNWKKTLINNLKWKLFVNYNKIIYTKNTDISILIDFWSIPLMRRQRAQEYHPDTHRAWANRFIYFIFQIYK